MRILFAILVAVVAVKPAFAQKANEVHGLLRQVDAAQGTITVTPAREKEAKAFSLLKRDLPITHALGHALKLEDLRPGQRVLLRLDDDEGFVTAVRLDSDCLWGFVTRLDPAKDTLVVKLGYVTRTIMISPAMQLLQNGMAARVADLHVGQGLVVTFSPDHRRVLQVRAGKGISGSNPYTAVGVAGGLLVEVDHVRKRLHIITLAERHQKQEFEYDDWAFARLTYSSYVLRETNIHDLVAPCRVSFHYDRDTKKVSALDVDVPKLLRRKVEKFDRERRRITLWGDDDKKEELPLVDDVKVMREYRPGTIADVKEGVIVNAGLTPDGKTVVFLQAWPR